jgi:hypothetical protein
MQNKLYFRYSFKSTLNKRILTAIFDLTEISNGTYTKYKDTLGTKFKLDHIDRFTGLLDINKDKIFENDTLAGVHVNGSSGQVTVKWEQRSSSFRGFGMRTSGRTTISLTGLKQRKILKNG